MERKIVLKKEVIELLNSLEIKKGDSLIVHTSLKSIGFLCGGPQILIDSLMEVLGNEGTLMMPTQSWKNLDPLDGVHWEEPEEWWQLIRDNWPAYDKKITPTNTMGKTAEMFRNYEGVLRSDHPARSFAAWGKNALWLTSDHDLSNIFGDGSPLSKLYDLDGKVLLIGVGYDKNTSLHLADARANYPSKHNCVEYSAVMENGKRVWKRYETLFVDGDDFVNIGEAFENEQKVKQAMLGNAVVKVMSVKELVDFAICWIEKNRK